MEGTWTRRSLGALLAYLTLALVPAATSAETPSAPQRWPVGGVFDDLAHAPEPEAGARGARARASQRAASAVVWEAEF